MGNKNLGNYLKIGENLKKYRTAAGYTQRDFARKIGTPISTYSNYENGNRTPGPEFLSKVAEELDIPFNALVYTSNKVEQLLEPENEWFLKQVAEEIDVPEDYLHIAIRTKCDLALLHFLEKIVDTLDAANKKDPPEEKRISVITNRIKKALELLNEEGQQKAVERVEELTEIPKYQKPDEK